MRPRLTHFPEDPFAVKRRGEIPTGIRSWRLRRPVSFSAKWRLTVIATRRFQSECAKFRLASLKRNNLVAVEARQHGRLIAFTYGHPWR